MRLLHAISNDEMVAVFLQTEVTSTRFGPIILTILRHDGRDRQIIDQPDLSAADDNVYRRHVLGAYRGYRRDADVFTDVPDDVRWYRCDGYRGHPCGKPSNSAARMTTVAITGVVDATALLDALRAGRLAGAAVDVLAHEPPIDDPLYRAYRRGEAPTLLMTPHIAWYSRESAAELRGKAAAEAGRLLRGEPPWNPVS